jgi:hypothetical protein
MANNFEPDDIPSTDSEGLPKPAKEEPSREGAENPIGDPFAKIIAPDLSRGILPAVIEAFAEREAETKGVSFHAPAMAALTVAAAAIPDQVQIRVKVHEAWREPARLWLALIGPPSAKKSPVMRSVMTPLKTIEHRATATWKAEEREWRKLDKETRGDPPKLKRHILNDSTIEAAGKVLADNDHGLLMERDELAGMFGALDKYNSGRGGSADRAFWLQAWNGGSYTVDRSSRPSLYISNMSVSILGGIQPSAIRKIAADTTDDGLIQRLLPVIVNSAKPGNDEPDLGHAFKAYTRLIERLNEMQPHEVRFTAEGHDIRRALDLHLHDLHALEDSNPKFVAFCGKLNGVFARICLVFHCCERRQLDDPFAGEDFDYIDEGTVKRADRLIREFIIPHAMSFYLELTDDGGRQEQTRSIAGYILAKKLERFTCGTLTSGVRCCRGKSRREIQEMLELLEMLNWIEPEDWNERRSWTVHSRVHELFAARTVQERERRGKVRKVLLKSVVDTQGNGIWEG